MTICSTGRSYRLLKSSLILLLAKLVLVLRYRVKWQSNTCADKVPISSQVPPEHREFSMGVTSVPINGGIALAGVAVLPAHRAFCTYWRNKMRS